MRRIVIFFSTILLNSWVIIFYLNKNNHIKNLFIFQKIKYLYQLRHSSSKRWLNALLYNIFQAQKLFNTMDEQDFYDDDQKAKIIKLVLVGQSGVGKTNVILRYVEDKFMMATNTTIGIQFSQKTIKVNKRKITVQIWDTAGQERFRALNKTFYHNALGAILLFDLTNRDSFNEIGRWMNQLKQHIAQCAVFLLVGNKSDLRNRTVTVNQATAYAKQQGMGYLETSAALGNNIDEAFSLLTGKIIEQIDQIKETQKNEKTFKSSETLNKRSLYRIQPTEKKKKGCC